MSTALARWLMAALVLANLAALYWFQFRPGPPAPVLSERGGRLVLLSELDSAPARALPDPDSRAPDAGPAPVSLAGLDASIREALEAAAASPATPAPAITIDLVEMAALEPVRVLAERIVAPPVAPDTGSAAAAGDEQRVCWRVGPLDDANQLAALEVLLLEADIPRRARTEVVPLETRYWVYLDVAGDAGRRQALREELRRRKLDNYLIVSGALEGQLSLGLFRTLERARIIQQQRIEQGYDARIFESRADEEVSWYLLDSSDIERLEWPVEAGPVLGFDDIALEPLDCSEAAVSVSIDGRDMAEDSPEPVQPAMVPQ